MHGNNSPGNYGGNVPQATINGVAKLLEMQCDADQVRKF